jgi:hypothetical protein
VQIHDLGDLAKRQFLLVDIYHPASADTGTLSAVITSSQSAVLARRHGVVDYLMAWGDTLSLADIEGLARTPLNSRRSQARAKFQSRHTVFAPTGRAAPIWTRRFWGHQWFPDQDDVFRLANELQLPKPANLFAVYAWLAGERKRLQRPAFGGVICGQLPPGRSRRRPKRIILR